MSIEVDGREVLVTLPENYDALVSVPVIVAFHGLGSKAEHMSEVAGLENIAKINGYILVCPNGQEIRFPIKKIKAWNAGSCCGFLKSPPKDDVAFVKKMLDAIQKEHTKMDKEKVFLVGMSNGAMLAHLLAFKLKQSDYNISAIATVSGTMAFDKELGDESYTIPIMHIHGSDDKIIPTVGWPFRPGMRCKSVEETIQIWRERSLAEGDEGVTTRTIGKATSDDSTVVLEKTYPPSSPGGSPVVSVSIKNAGHTWPGHANPKGIEKYMRKLGDSGIYTEHIKAEELILDFFQPYI